MKITGIKLYKIRPRWLFLKVETDEEGIFGWGEPVVEGRADVVKAMVEDCAYYYMGKNPLDIEDIWQTLFRSGFYRGGPELMSAIAGIDQALWDIKGKVLGVPVYQLLGGKCRDKIRVYSWIGGNCPSDVVNGAKQKLEQGFTAIKMNATGKIGMIDSFQKIQEVVERIASIRDAVGYQIDVGIDFHGRLHKSMAKIMAKELEPYHPMFIEEPVMPEHNEALREIARHTTIPIATGERMFSRWDFKRVLQDGYVDIIQPDLSHAGGISECRKIAAMAEAYDVAVAPHCPLGPIALASCFQVDSCTPNVFIQEQSLGMHYNVGNDLLDTVVNKSLFAYENGYAPLPQKPGLGIEIEEGKAIELDREGHNFKVEAWRSDDGTIVEF